MPGNKAITVNLLGTEDYKAMAVRVSQLERELSAVRNQFRNFVQQVDYFRPPVKEFVTPFLDEEHTCGQLQEPGDKATCRRCVATVIMSMHDMLRRPDDQITHHLAPHG